MDTRIIYIYNIKTPFILLCMVFLLSACAMPSRDQNSSGTEKNSPLTQGNVQLNLRVGQTTKFEVLENFGSPNATTRDGKGREVWTYQRSARVSRSSSQSNYWTIIIAGQSSDSSGFETSSRMITLIIKFDENDVVTDFRSRTANF